MHIYKREFVESQGTQLYLPGGELSQCFEIGFPQEGRITRMLLRQSSGPAVALVVNLFDRQVCDVGSGSSTSLEDVDPMTQALAKIIPTQNVNAGVVLELFENDGPWSYRNREGTFTVPVRAVYLHITVPTNDNGLEFELALECEVGNERN